jgi:hypothetical protein
MYTGHCKVVLSYEEIARVVYKMHVIGSRAVTNALQFPILEQKKLSLNNEASTATKGQRKTMGSHTSKATRLGDLRST